jgi:uncharacterized protein DUF2784
MLERLAADAVLVGHLAFIAFVMLGALAVWRWRWVTWLHVPALAWAAFVEASGRVCPLTPLENALRMSAGDKGYAGDFVEHYLLAIVYPSGLTREIQWLLAALVLIVNALLYGRLWLRARRSAPLGG